MLPSQYSEVQGYPNLRRFLEVLVDMQFADLRDLVRLPAYGIKSGMNLTTTARLFDTISGCSICFYNATPTKLSTVGISGKEFKSFLTAYFPWTSMPVPKAEALDVFYLYGRNPLAHALGADIRANAPVIEIVKRNWPLKRVLELEDSPTLPKWIAPPLIGGNGHYRLSVAALFWAVHRMLHSLFADTAQAQAADIAVKNVPL